MKPLGPRMLTDDNQADSLNAAQELEKHLRKFAWYHSVGVGETAIGPMLFVYVKSSRHRELELIKDGWMGYPVIVRTAGRPNHSDEQNENCYGNF